MEFSEPTGLAFPPEPTRIGVSIAVSAVPLSHPVWHTISDGWAEKNHSVLAGYNARSGLGVSDPERARKLLTGIVGKRLTYRRPDETAHA